MNTDVQEQKDAINPSHYQTTLVIPARFINDHINPETGDLELQYIEVMEYSMTLSEFIGHLKGQCFKYLLRLGKKDAPSQEASKSSWYSDYLAKTLKKWEQ